MTDLQKLNAADLQSADVFYRAVGRSIADALDLDASPDDSWEARRGPSVNFERYLRRQVLAPDAPPLVWAIDEADRLFTCDFGSEVFGLFRSWHNARALAPVWSRLTLAIAYATEAFLFITDLNQSPFNVGTLVSLEDFNAEQVAWLNSRYGSPLRDADELRAFHRLVGGQPYLVNRGLYQMAQRGLRAAAFQAEAARDDGVLGDHLRRMLVLLAQDEELCEVVRGVLHGRPCPTPKTFYRLRSAGVVAGESAPRGPYALRAVREIPGASLAMSLDPRRFFVTGGNLRVDAPCYVPRQADHDLLEGLLRGEFCYVLTSRQMGKSSLMVRTAQRLRGRGRGGGHPGS